MLRAIEECDITIEQLSLGQKVSQCSNRSMTTLYVDVASIMEQTISHTTNHVKKIMTSFTVSQCQSNKE